MSNTRISDLPNNTPIEELNYEEAFTQLEAIVEALESGEHSAEQIPLDKALALFERGQALARYCSGLLDKAELRVKQISGEEIIDFEN